MTLPDVKQMSTADLETLLDAISLERAKREPQVSMEQPKTMEAALDPRWHVSLSGPNSILQLRHPGYGWVGYVIPPASRATFVSALLQHALMPPSRADGPPPVVTMGGGTVH